MSSDRWTAVGSRSWADDERPALGTHHLHLIALAEPQPAESVVLSPMAEAARSWSRSPLANTR